MPCASSPTASYLSSRAARPSNGWCQASGVALHLTSSAFSERQVFDKRSYLLNHRRALTRFLDDGIVPIDNGVVERLHRRPAIGRRNFLFAGSHAGAERAAIAYSVLAKIGRAHV